MPSVLGNLLFLSFAFTLGLIWFTVFLVILYKIFYRDSQDGENEMSVDEVPIDQETVNMEEIQIEL